MRIAAVLLLVLSCSGTVRVEQRDAGGGGAGGTTTGTTSSATGGTAGGGGASGHGGAGGCQDGQGGQRLGAGGACDPEVCDGEACGEIRDACGQYVYCGECACGMKCLDGVCE